MNIHHARVRPSSHPARGPGSCTVLTHFGAQMRMCASQPVHIRFCSNISDKACASLRRTEILRVSIDQRCRLVVSKSAEKTASGNLAKTESFAHGPRATF